MNIVGRYALIEELGAGGMGTVWRGYDAVLDREVAVKLIRPDMVASPDHAEELVQRFQREARVTARIRHHGVPQVYDAVLDPSSERLYLVMELVRGTPLRAFVDPDRSLPVSWAAAVAAQICTVLSHAHAVPVVHRDLKPDNVLVTGGGTVKVLDFGIAAILRTDVTRITATGSPLGTSQYMSPEQVTARQVTPHSDLYAVGCILHELLCGRPVFGGNSDFERMRQHVSTAPRPLRQLRDDVPDDLERLVLHLLEKVPERRPADAYEVHERLVPFLPLPGATLPDVGAGPAGVPDPTLMYRRPNAPRPRPEAKPVPPVPPVVDRPDEVPPLPVAQVREAMRAAVAASDELLEDERFAQAADVLRAAIGPAAVALGVESPNVLRLRARRAAVLVLGGDYRSALPELDALVEAYGRTAGPTSEDALDCLKQAALCRAALGHTTAALRQFQEVLAGVRAVDGDASSTALELRRHVGQLLLAEGRVPEALDVLRPLYDDLCLLYGTDHAESQEIADLLTRIRLASG